MGSIVRQRTGPLMAIWLSLVLTSLPIHIILNGIIGYAVFDIAPIEGRASLASNYTQPTNSTNIIAQVCFNYLISAFAYIADYDNMVVILQPGHDEYLDGYEMYARGGPRWTHTFTLCWPFVTSPKSNRDVS